MSVTVKVHNSKESAEILPHGNTSHSNSHLRLFPLLAIPKLESYSHYHAIPAGLFRFPWSPLCHTLPDRHLSLGSRVVSVLDSGAERPGFKSQPRRCRVTVLGKLFTPVVPLFTKQQNWQQPS